MRTFLRSFIESLQFKYYFSPYFASAEFKEEMGAQKARPAAKKPPVLARAFLAKNRNNYAQLFQDYPDVVSTLQLCEMLGVCERTVYQLLMTNQIKHFRIGRAYRIPKVNVIAFMENESAGRQTCSNSVPVLPYSHTEAADTTEQEV